MSKGSSENTKPRLQDLLGEPIVHLVMQADDVDVHELRTLLELTAASARNWRDVARLTKDPERDKSTQSDSGYRLGVGITLLDKRGNIFVGQRIDVTEQAWQMPQGGIEEGETRREAALRELREELGASHVKILAETQTWFRYDFTASISRGVAPWPLAWSAAEAVPYALSRARFRHRCRDSGSRVFAMAVGDHGSLDRAHCAIQAAALPSRFAGIRGSGAMKGGAVAILAGTRRVPRWSRTTARRWPNTFGWRTGMSAEMQSDRSQPAPHTQRVGSDRAAAVARAAHGGACRRLDRSSGRVAE
jgi:8-oxo-dGTP pyrophosphatase MutT (NUDIX family)